jgi:hypothetical protein
MTMLLALGVSAQPALQTLITSGLSEPYGVAVDPKDNYYITDSVNNRIAKYNPNLGVLTNLAGVLGETGFSDGPGVFAQFHSPQGIVYARGGLVVADSGNHAIRYITLAGQVSTIAGGTAGFADGAGAAARFNAPAGLAADAAGNIYVADLLNNRVRRIDLANNVTTVAAGLSRPTAVTIDPASNRIYVADTGSHSILTIQSDGTVSLFAGSGSSFISGSRDHLVALNALFNAPRGLLWVGGQTGLLVSDTGNQRVRRIYFNSHVNNHSVETFVSSPLVAPIGLARDAIGNFPLVDLNAGRLYSIQVTAAQPPVSNPQIGIVTLSTNLWGDLVTHLVTVTNSTFNNDVKVAILGETGTETFYTLDPGANFPEDPLSRNTPPLYSNGLPQWNHSIIVPAIDGSNVIIRAAGMQDGRRPSETVTARFQFKVANPVIHGKNMGNFTLSVNTEGAQLWYTTDGSIPINGTPSRLYIPGSHLNIVDGTNDVVFTVRAFKPGYTPSSEVARTFLFADLETSTIGVTRDFSAGIGSTIIVPIEVKMASAEQLRSLQFRFEVTPLNGAPPISTQIRYLMIGTNDFVRLPPPTEDHPWVNVYQNGPTTGIAVAYIANIELHPPSGGEGNLFAADSAVVALIAVPIPPNAVAGQTYTIDLVHPSGTSDAVQSPIPLRTFASRTITVQNISYVVGDSAIGAWYNAGDFGNGNLNNNDVNNAFLASLGIYTPYPFTDVHDAMDAFPPDSLATVGGDGQIRYLDWQLILRRSLRLSDDNWQRSWSAGGVRAPAGATLNTAANLPGQMLIAPPPGAVWVRQALFEATPIGQVQPGQSVQVPIYVNVGEDASLSGLQFLAKIAGSESAPPLAQSATFVLAKGIPSSRPVAGLAQNQVAYAWDVGSFDPPLQGRVLLGHVQFTVPASAQTGQFYRLRFANADGAPDLDTQYDFESLSASIWVNAPAQSRADFITDEWKVKFFGSIDSPLADPFADPDKDGIPNWKEYLAGTDPTDRESRLHLGAPEERTNDGRKQVGLRWLTAPGKKYIIETTDDLTGGQWTIRAEGISGDGRFKEFIDANITGAAQYYRVRLQN